MTTWTHPLVVHVRESISRAARHESKLPPEVMDIVGMSSPKVRHLLNNLCNRPGTRYLEIGTHFGSTLISAIHGNAASLDHVTAIDRFVRDDCRMLDLLATLARFAPEQRVQLLAQDSFRTELGSLAGGYNVYFYDGDHSEEAQKKAITYFHPALADEFVLVVDDFRRLQVQDGTYAGLIEMGCRTLFDTKLAARSESDRKLWWNGLFVGVMRKGGMPCGSSSPEQVVAAR